MVLGIGDKWHILEKLFRHMWLPKNIVPIDLKTHLALIIFNLTQNSGFAPPKTKYSIKM